MTPKELIEEANRRRERREAGLPLTEATGKPVVDDLATVVRTETECRITIKGPPRTKKNSTTLGIRQSPAYRKFCADVKLQLREFRPPLADKPYNLAAQFYVDDYGRLADLIGLLQGLADALEAAKVVSNDKVFLGFDHSRKHTDDRKNPRVEIHITELAPSIS